MSNETIKTYTGSDIGASQCLVTLEGFIGDLDGKTIGTETASGLFDDEGTVDTSDAVTAINGLIFSLEQRDAEIEKLLAALKPFAEVPPHSPPTRRCIVMDAGAGPYHFLQSDLDHAKSLHPPSPTQPSDRQG